MSPTKHHTEQELHFYPVIKEKLLKEAKSLGFPEELIANAEASALFEMIKEHQFSMLLQTEMLLSSAPSLFAR